MMAESGKKSQTNASAIWHFLSRISLTHLAIAQGIYYILGGIWPVLSIRTFQSLTGPKTDIWLVHTSALLLVVIGSVLLTAGIRWRVSLEILVLGLGSAAALAAIEIVYVAKGLISPIYLLDGLLELVFIGFWVSMRMRGLSSPEVCTLYDPTLSESE